MSTTSKLIGVGGNGCIYHPPLKCKNGDSYYRNKKYVMKYSDEYDPQESKINKILKKIDRDENYFIYIVDECVIDDSEEKLLKLCKHYDGKKNDRREKKKESIGKFMKYGGVDLLKYIVDDKNKPNLNTLIRWFIKLVYALKILHDNKILHGDIKPENILVLDGDVYLTDFGLSSTQDEPNLMNNFYSIYPPFYLIATIPEEERIDLDDTINYFHLNQAYYGLDYKSSISKYLDILRKLKTRYTEYMIVPNIYKIDIWCLGLAFYRIYNTLKRDLVKENKELVANDMREDFENLLHAMTNSDVDEQFDMNAIIDYIQANFKDIGESIFTRYLTLYPKDLKKIGNCDIPNVIIYEGENKIYYCFELEQFRNVKDLTINPLNPSEKLTDWFVQSLKEKLKR